MLQYAIVLPAGSGKSTLSSKYDFLIDIDSLHTQQFREELKLKYNETLKTGNWDLYNKIECDWILPKIANFPSNYVLLVHCPEKAHLLNLQILGSFKPSYNIIKNVVENRGKERGNLTIHNWETVTDSKILDSHNDIETEVLKCIKEINN
tara:strand:+ start:744 stop:1193 length:450 start_codon:yes stop_codon:yes gene_type:complete